MTVPTLVGTHTNALANYGATLTGSFDVGADPVSIVAFGIAGGAASGTRCNAITLNGTTPMTAGTDRSLAAESAGTGRVRDFELIASGLTGTVSYSMAMTLLNGTSDANSRPVVIFAWFKDAATVTRTTKTFVSASGGTNMSAAISSDANSSVIYLATGDSTTSTLTAQGTSSLDINTSLDSRRLIGLSEAGAAGTVTVEASVSTTIVHGGMVWNLTGAANPVLSSPTGTATGPTHATIGATIDAATTGTLYGLKRVGGSPASSATIIATGTTLAVTSAGAKTFADTGYTTNTAAVADLVYVDATNGTSNVVTTGSFTPSTLAIAATALSAQSGYQTTTLVWAGVTPESLVTNTGIGAGSWAITAGVGASGITSCNASTGVLVSSSLGTPGSYTITLTRSDSSTAGTSVPQTVTKDVSLTLTAPVVFTGTIPTKTGVVGSAFSWGTPSLASYFSLGTAPYAYSVIVGTLPAGLSLNSSTGVISGTPTTAATSSVTLRATDAVAATANTNSFSFTISASGGGLAFTGTVANKTGINGNAFNWGTPALDSFISGGTAPYSYAILSGVLAPGLALDSATGVISGTPTTAYVSTLVIRITDAAGSPAHVDSNSFTITIANIGGTYTATFGPGYYTTGSGPQLSKVANWSVFPGGTPGALAGISPVDGVSTCDSNGIWTCSGIPQAGAAIVIAKDSDGGIYYEPVTAA